MTWMAKLYETYEQAIRLDLPEDRKLMPVSHTLQNAHINIVVDASGNFLRAKVLEKMQIVLPATEKSAGRTAGEAPHPLADKIQYVAGDYKKYGGGKPSYYKGYLKQLFDWCSSDFAHPKAIAVHAYVSKACLIEDLINSSVLYVDGNHKLLKNWKKTGEVDSIPTIFKVLPKEKGELDQGSALVCWSVEVPGEPLSESWLDESLYQSWINFDALNSGLERFCVVSGRVSPAASNHPAKIRHTGDKAKLISAPSDATYLTYQGRFTDVSQVCGVSFDVTQKAHNALRWLISNVSRSGRNGDQVVIAWAISGREIPCPTDDLMVLDLDNLDVVDDGNVINDVDNILDHSVDIGQSFSRSLNRYISGYRATLKPAENIIIMALDSATPGRMGIVYYRDIFASEYLDTIERWHSDFAWPQRVVKDIEDASTKKNKQKVVWLPFAPSPYSILNTAYGDIIKSSDTLKKSLYERLIPCIVEGVAFPWDLVSLAVKRASNRNVKRFGDQYSTPHSELIAWEKDLGVACALYRGYHNRHPIIQKRRNYSMSLETENRSRDYLYGRLLAIADAIEGCALRIADEKRPTNAARLMQRFADRPFSTWRTIKLGLSPYIHRLQNSRYAGFLFVMEKELDCVSDLFEASDFTSDKALSGEFLLGYHCQRQALRNPESNADQA